MRGVIRGIVFVVLLVAASVIAHPVLFPQSKADSALVAIPGISNNSGIDYYPSSLDNGSVKIEYYEDRTVVTISKKMRRWEVACTGSMHPLMGCGNTLLTESVSSDTEISVGDIVVYNSENGYIGHQVVGYDPDADCYLLKGTNSAAVDAGCVKKEDIVARQVLILPTDTVS